MHEQSRKIIIIIMAILQGVDDVDLVFDGHRAKHDDGRDNLEGIDESVAVRVKQIVQVFVTL